MEGFWKGVCINAILNFLIIGILTLCGIEHSGGSFWVGFFIGALNMCVFNLCEHSKSE